MEFELQRANIWKRISAIILDVILVCILSTGVMYVISGIVDYDSYSNKLEEYYIQYAEDHGIKTFEITQDEYNAFSEAERAKYDAAYKALIEDEDVLYTYSMVQSLMLLITSLSIFVAYAVLDFIAPLLFGNGQTVGKKIFGLAVIRFDGVKIDTFMLFVRTLLGKFTVETMIPVMLVIMLVFNIIGFVGLAVLLLILLLQVILLFATRNHTVIHDAFARTVVVDLQSQLIFDTPEELLAYKKKLAADAAAKTDY